MLAASQVSGSEVTGAQAGTASSQTSISGQWQVNLSLNGAGSTAFGNLTSQLASKYYANGAATSILDQVAVVLDGQIVSDPDIQSAIPSGQAEISPFTQSQASTLAQELNHGSLPISFPSRTSSPSPRSSAVTSWTRA